MASDNDVLCTLEDANFATVYSFLKVFGKLYGLEVPTITKLQEFTEDTQKVSDVLKDIHVRLLRRALRSVQHDRWEKCLIKFCHQRGHHQEAWEIERFTYKKASVAVKLKVLKLLLEYQFTCHPKFKNAVNSMPSNELRLKPIGKDKLGCVYWYQVDHEANLLLFKENQDEETWQLVARNKEELIRVISQLKNGEEVAPLNDGIFNEDSSSTEMPAEKSNVCALKTEDTNVENKEEHVENDENEEFLSPESELSDDNEVANKKEGESNTLKKLEEGDEYSSKNTDNINEPLSEEQKVCKSEKNATADAENLKNDDATADTENLKSNDDPSSKLNETDVTESIEEPVMLVTGEGNGADCESAFFLSEEITEPVMYIYGYGCGYDNETGNTETARSDSNNTDNVNQNSECFNGEQNQNCSSSKKVKLVKTIKLRSNVSNINRSTLKKPCNDTPEITKNESKKQCTRNLDKVDCANGTDCNKELDETSNKSKEENDSSKKTKAKVKKIVNLKKIKCKVRKESLNSVSDENPLENSKCHIIEKRKGSLSSEEQSIENDEIDCVDNEAKTEESLPPKKQRLETESEQVQDVITKNKNKLNDSANSESDQSSKKVKCNSEEEKVTTRKKIKAKKGKFKRKSNKILNVDKLKEEETDLNSKDNKSHKSLKRSIVENVHKEKSESQSESAVEEEATLGKRLKIKSKKIIKAARKRVEEKLNCKKSSDDSDDETLYSLAGIKAKQLSRKKLKDKKANAPAIDDDDDISPVRQSRRIAQMKIKEEADRRHLEEVALRELKKKHKKKGNKDDEDEWKASPQHSSQSESDFKKKKTSWKASDTTGPDNDSDTDDQLFAPEQDNAELVFDKSDHEFSPESDLEDDSQPLRRVRTLVEASAESGACVRCGSGEQPEWILLCDACDAPYHASCLQPVLLAVPDGEWFCPPCDHAKLIASLEEELIKYEQLCARVEKEREERKGEEQDKKSDKSQNGSQKDKDSESESEWSSSSSGGVYRLRARRQLPVSYHAREYDRLISSAIKEEYVEPTSSAGNQGRGKDISTIIEAAEEEKMKAAQEALQQGKLIDLKKLKKKQRRKPRKLNSLEVPSEDDNETDEDFKDTGLEPSSEDISSSAERESSASGSSDSLPLRRTGRSDKKSRKKLTESSPEVKRKKKGVFTDSSSESSGTKDWKKKKPKSKSRSKSHAPRKKRSGLTQYDAEGNVVRARVTYGGLSDSGPNDWSPKHRTRQKKIDYTEMPNTESEDEMHKSSGKHMPDSSDEFRLDESDLSSDSDYGKKKKPAEEEDCPELPLEEKQRAITDLVSKTAVVPLEKLPDDVTRAKTEELQAHLEAKAAQGVRPTKGRGSRGGRKPRSGRGGKTRGENRGDGALANLVGVKIKDLSQENLPPTQQQIEREKKKQEREAKLAEKEARRQERLQKKEEKEKLKEQRAREREEKKAAKLALQENKKKRETMAFGQAAKMPLVKGPRPAGPEGQPMYQPQSMPIRHPAEFHDQRFPAAPRLQVRAELRSGAPERPPLTADGRVSVAGSPQPFRPAADTPSVITRLPRYAGPMMYNPGNPAYGPRPPQNMAMYHMQHPMGHPHNIPAHQYPQGYYPHLQGLPPGYPNPQHMRPPHPSPQPPHINRPISGPMPPSSMSPVRQGMIPHPGIPVSIQNTPQTQSLALIRRPNPTMVHGTSGLPLSIPRQPPLNMPGHNLPPGANMPHMQRMPINAAGSPDIQGQPRLPPPRPQDQPVSNPNQQSNGAPRSAPTGEKEPPLVIKTEVKTEPEYHSPRASPDKPSSPAEEPPRHPKIKHTESKDRKPCHPLGPYAPQYGPYGPYAPPTSQPHAPPDLSRLENPYLPRDPKQPEPRIPLNPHADRPRHIAEQMALPPHYMPSIPQHLRPQLRPPFGMPMIRHPERHTIPRHLSPYPQYPEHNPNAEKRAAQNTPPSQPTNEPTPLVVRPQSAERVSTPPVNMEKPPPVGAKEVDSKEAPNATENIAIGPVKVENSEESAKQIKVEEAERPSREEGSVFGGLVSYFSSQHEDNIDA